MMHSDFADWFRSITDRACPVPEELRPTVSRGKDVWISPSLALSPAPLPMRPEFLEVPREYILAGFWGHGVASYALYYVAVTPRHRAFFRLPFGGIYGDRERETAFVVGYLEAYVEFRARLLAELDRSILIHDMGTSYGELTRNGRMQQLSEEESAGPSMSGRFFSRLDELMNKKNP